MPTRVSPGKAVVLPITGLDRVLATASVFSLVLDLAPFYRAHRDDGHGHSAYDPKQLLACCCMATAWACGPPGRSNAAATKTSPSGYSRRTRPPIM
jgi:hypothetical protein